MADIRHCDQCGTAFEPRREHARFCSAGCRVSWNRGHRRDPFVELGALGWSVAAMGDLAPHLAGLAAGDSRTAAVAGEAVWQVTIVDATLVRYHHELYDSILAGQSPADRRLTEGTMAGLRFVRNHMTRVGGCDALIGPRGCGPDGPCAWQPVPDPATGSPRSRGRVWQQARYQAYQEFLVGHLVSETIGRAAQFLRAAAAVVPAASDVSAPAGP